MKKIFFYLFLGVVIQSCNLLDIPSESDPGELRISFADRQEALTRAGLEIPDTSDFILSVCDAKGKSFYHGAYGDSPESMSVPAGSYTISVISEEFTKPGFSSPQFGDEQCVVVTEGGTVNVRLVCTQLNVGIRLRIASAFLDVFPDGVLLLKSSFGRLVYGYSEKRVAYFKPGNISLVLSEGGRDEVLLTRELKAQDMLDLKVGVAAGSASLPETSAGRISVAVDTSRNWLNGSFVIGGSDNGGSVPADAMTVAQALLNVGSEDVWVNGYIVGGDLTSSSASFERPFSSRTNLLLGPRSSTRDKESCLSVQLPSGELREILNLVDNPDMHGRKVSLRGDIVEAYYGIPGIKNITDFEVL